MADGVADKVRLGIIGLGAQGSMYAKFIADGMVPEHGDRRDRRHRSGKAAAAAAGLRRARSTPTTSRCWPAATSTRSSPACRTTCTRRSGSPPCRRGIHALVEKPAGVYTRQVNELNAYAADQARADLRASCSTSATTRCTSGSRRSSTPARSARSATPAGSSPPGGVRRATTTRAHGGPPGAARAAAYWSTRHRTSSTCGSGSAGSRSRSTPRSPTGSAATSPSRTRSPRSSTTATAPPASFVTADHDLVGTDRFEILGDKGKIVVDGQQDRHRHPAGQAGARAQRRHGHGRRPQAVHRASSTRDDCYTQEVIEFDSAWGAQHAGVLENFAANILDGTPLLAPGSDGINGVRLANAIHLSSWTGARSARLRRGRVPRRAQPADPRRGQVPRAPGLRWGLDVPSRTCSRSR